MQRLYDVQMEYFGPLPHLLQLSHRTVKTAFLNALVKNFCLPFFAQTSLQSCILFKCFLTISTPKVGECNRWNICWVAPSPRNAELCNSYEKGRNFFCNAWSSVASEVLPDKRSIDVNTPQFCPNGSEKLQDSQWPGHCLIFLFLRFLQNAHFCFLCPVLPKNDTSTDVSESSSIEYSNTRIFLSCTNSMHWIKWFKFNLG